MANQNTFAMIVRPLGQTIASHENNNAALMRRYVSAYGMPLGQPSNTDFGSNYRQLIIEVSIGVSH